MEHHKRQDPTSFQTVQLFELRLGAGTDPGAAAALDAGVSVGAGAVAVAVAVAVALLLLPRPRARRATDSALGSALGIFPTLTPFNAAALVLALALLGGVKRPGRTASCGSAATAFDNATFNFMFPR